MNIKDFFYDKLGLNAKEKEDIEDDQKKTITLSDGRVVDLQKVEDFFTNREDLNELAKAGMKHNVGGALWESGDVDDFDELADPNVLLDDIEF